MLFFPPAQLAAQSVHSLHLWDQAAPAFTSHSCSWMSVHPLAQAVARPERHSPAIPTHNHTHTEVASEKPLFQVSFLIYNKRSDQLMCCEVPPGAGELYGPVEVSQEATGKLLWKLSSGTRKKILCSFQLTKRLPINQGRFYPSLLSNLLIRPSSERIAGSLWTAGNIT